MDLEQHVPELVDHLGVIAAAGGIRQLVGLLEGEWDYRPLVLLAVPRAFDPENPGQLVEPFNRRGVVGGAQRATTQPPEVAGVCWTVAPEAPPAAAAALGAFLQSSMV